MLEILALGAASGKFNKLSSFRVSGCLGTRKATLGNPAVTKSGTASFFGIKIVNEPGQNASANCRASGENSVTYFNTSSVLAMCTISGLKLGRCLALYILETAEASKAFAANP